MSISPQLATRLLVVVIALQLTALAACAVLYQDDDRTYAASLLTDSAPSIHHPSESHTSPDVEFVRAPIDPASAEAKRLDKLMLLGIIGAVAGVALWIGRATYPPLKLMPTVLPYAVAGLGGGMVAWATIGEGARIWIFIAALVGGGILMVRSWLHNHKLKNHDPAETYTHGWTKEKTDVPQ